VSHPTLADHPILAVSWLLIIGLKLRLLTRPLPVPLTLWAVVSIVRSVLLFLFTWLWWTNAWTWWRYKGGFVEDGFVFLCALWCFWMMFWPERTDMRHIWIKQFILSACAGLVCIIIVNGRHVTDLQPIEVASWGSTLFLAGTFWILAIFGDWADGNPEDLAARDARIVALGFLVAYTLDVAADGIATWSARTMGARMPLWAIGMTASAGVYLYWIHTFRKQPR
jgi:hypothetical protein